MGDAQGAGQGSAQPGAQGPATPPPAEKSGVGKIVLIIGGVACGCLVLFVGISIVAAIAIPNLLRSKMAANECTAIAALRTCAGAQSIYHRTDYDSDGVLEYCGPSNNEAPSLTYLATTVANGRPIELIELALAQAMSLNTPWEGYFFVDIARGADGQPYDAASDYGLCAVPAQYNRTGIHTFIIDANGIVYMRDTGSGIPITQWPDVNDPNSGWMSCE